MMRGCVCAPATEYTNSTYANCVGHTGSASIMPLTFNTEECDAFGFRTLARHHDVFMFYICVSVSLGFFHK